MEPLLLLEHINKSYSLGAERVQVLFDINLQVMPGRFHRHFGAVWLRQINPDEYYRLYGYG